MVLTLVPGGLALGQSPADAPSPEALKYHEMLRRRPQPGVVLDRFTSAWLSHGSRESLEAFLRTKSEAAEAAASDHLILALFYSASGKESEALQACERAAALTPDDAQLHLRAAEIATRLKEWESALKSVNRATQLGLTGESDIRATRLQTQILWRLGQTDEAKRTFRALIARHPEEHDLREELVDMLVENGLKPEAAEESKQLVDLTQDPLAKAMRRLRLADLLVDLRKTAQARTELEQSLTQSGTDSWLEGETLDRVEKLYRRTGDLPGLATRLSDLAKQHPNRVSIVRRQMRILSELARPVDASAVAAELLKRTPGRRDVREDYVTLLEAQAKIPEAIQQLEELLRQNPNDGALMLRLAGLHGRNGTPDRTRALIDAFLNLAPDDEGAMMQAGRLLEQLTLDDAARAVYEKWMLSHPQDPLAGLALTSLMHRKGDVQGAIALWRKLAAQGDINAASQVATAAANRGEHLAALEFLKAREKEFFDDLRLLSQVCNLAMEARQEEACIRWLRRYAELVKESGDLQRLATLTTSVLNRRTVRQKLLDDYAKRPPSGVGETILLAFAHDATTPENSYDERQSGERQSSALLADAWTALPHPANAPLSVEENLVETAQVYLLTRRRDWAPLLRILSDSIARPNAKTTTRLQTLAETSAAAFNYEASLNWVAEWKALTPSSHAPWRLQVKILRSMGSAAEMLEVLREAARRFPDQEDLTFELAAALNEADLSQEALAVFRGLFDQKQETQQRLRIGAQMVRTAKNAKMLDVLLDEWKRNQREHGDSSEAWRLLALVYREKPDVESYCQALTEAVRLAPNDISLIRDLAASEDARGNTAKAEELFRLAASKESTPQAKRSYAEFLLNRGEYPEALQIMQEIAQAQATTPTEIEELADSLMAMRLWRDAAVLLEEPVITHAKNARLQYQRGVALEESGRLDEAAQQFIRVLQILDEMLNAVPLPALEQPPVLPEAPGASLWSRLKETGAQSYMYRGWGEQGTQTMADQRATAPYVIALPQCREEAQVFALRHLARLAEVARVQSPPRPPLVLPAELPLAALSADLTLRHLWNRTVVHSTAQQVRTQPVLLADWLRGDLGIVDLTDPKDIHELRARAEQTFAKTHPVLAAEATLLQIFSCPVSERKAHLVRALQYARGSKNGKEHLAEIAEQLLGYSPLHTVMNARLGEPLSQEDVSTLLTALVGWAREAASADPGAGTILECAANCLSSSGRWEEWRDLLDEVAPQIRSNMAALTSQATARGFGMADLTFLPFPSQYHSGDGISPSACLPQNKGWQGAVAGIQAPANLADSAKEPLTKLLCLHAAGRTADLRAEVTRLVEAFPKRSDVLYLKASVLAADGQPDELSKALYEWATLPVPDEVGKARAQRLVNLAIEGNLPSDAAMQSVLLAAVRHLVTLGPVEDERHPSTPEMLRKAGFVTPAQMLTSVAVRRQGIGRITARPVMGAFTSKVAQDLLKQAEGAAESGAGMSAMTDTLNRYASDELSHGAGLAPIQTDSGWQWLHRTLLGKKPFRESLLKHLVNVAGTPQLGHAEAAFIHERLGDGFEPAMKYYQKALDENPANAFVRLRFVCLTLNDFPDVAHRIYTTAPVEDQNFIGRVLCQTSGQHSVMITQMISRFATRLFHEAAQQKDVRPLNLNWVFDLNSRLRWTSKNSSYAGIGDLLEVSPPLAEGAFGSTQLEQSMDGSLPYLLNDDLEFLCKAAMEVPDFSVSAFRIYAALKLKQGASVESLVPQAREVLSVQTRTAVVDFENFSAGTSGEPGHVWLPSPVALLALHASKQKDTHAAFNELTSLAKECRVEGAEGLIRALERLYTCSESDFPAAARTFGMLPTDSGRWQDLHPAVTVARVWRDRGLKIDPAPLVLTAACEAENDYRWGSAPGIVLETLAHQGERERARAFLIKVMELYLGTRAEWAEVVRKADSETQGMRWSKLSSLYNVMYSASQSDPMLTFITLDLAEEAGLRRLVRFPVESFLPRPLVGENTLYSVPAQKAADTLLQFLAASPWLKPGAPLWDCPLHAVQKKTVLTQVGQMIKALHRDKQEGIIATIEHAAPHNPGAALLHAFVRGDSTKVMDAMVMANTTIENSPPYVVEALGSIADTWFTPEQKKVMDSRMPQISTHLSKLNDLASARAADAFFTARSVESLRMSDTLFEETMRRAATYLASTDRAKAVKMLDRACELIVDKEKRGLWSGSGGSNGWGPCGEALNQWCNKTESLDVIAVACDLFHQPDEFNAVSAGWSYLPSWGGALATTWKNGGGLVDPSKGLQFMLQSLHTRLSIKKAPLLIPAFMDFHLKLDLWQRQEVLKAADELARQNGELSLYASWVGLAFRLNDLADGVLWLPDSQSEEAKSGVMLGFRMLMKDETINPVVRLILAHNLMNKAGKHADPETIWTAMDLATQALEKEWPAHGYLILYVLNTVNRLPVDERYKAAAARWLPAWINRNRTGLRGQDYNPVDEYQCAVLTLAARGLDDHGLRQVVRSLSPMQQRSSGNLLTLIRHDRNIVAREYYLQSRTNLVRASHNLNETSSKDMPKLEAFAASLPTADQRLHVLVYCGGLYANGVLRDHWADSRSLTWDRQMKELAKQVAQHSFQDNELKNQLMLELADAPGALSELQQEVQLMDLREMVRSASYGSSSKSLADTLRFPIEVTLNSLAEQIQKTPPEALTARGTVFPGPLPSPLDQAQLEYQTLMERMDSGRDSRTKAECMRHIEGNLFESTMLSAPSMGGASLAGFLPAWNKILRAYSDEKERFEEEALGVATQIVLSGLSGKLAETQAWREDVPHYRRDALKAQFLLKRHLMPVAQNLCRLDEGKWRSFEERWKLVQTFAADPWVLEYLQSPRDTISQLVRNRVLTIDEVLEHPSDLAVMFPSEGRVAAELAALLQVHGRMDDVPKLLALSVEQAKGHDALEVEWTLRQARWKTAHQQRDAAVKDLKLLRERVKRPELQKALDAALSTT